LTPPALSRILASMTERDKLELHASHGMPDRRTRLAEEIARVQRNAHFTANIQFAHSLAPICRRALSRAVFIATIPAAASAKTPTSREFDDVESAMPPATAANAAVGIFSDRSIPRQIDRELRSSWTFTPRCDEQFKPVGSST
jgi:hypothetical protein